MSVQAEDQTAIDERTIENEEFERRLEEREELRGEMAELRSRYRNLDSMVKLMATEFGLGEGEAIRVGRFRLELHPVAARTVNFETEPTSRLTIKLADAG